MLTLRLRYVFHATSPASGGAPLRLGSLIASERDAPAETLLGLRQGQLYVAGDSDIRLSRCREKRGKEGFFVPLYKNNAKNQKSSRKIFNFGKIFFRATRMVIFLLYGVPEKHHEYRRFLRLRHICDYSAGTVIMNTKPKGAVAHPLKKKDRSKSQKRLYNFGLLL